MTTTVFLVRHGSTDHLGHVISGRMDGVALNDAGHREAAAVAGRLRDQGIEAIYTSPLQRTRETAGAIGEALGLEPRAEDGLLEIEFGDWTGARFADLHGDPAWRRWNDERSAARAPNGETMGEVQDRLVRWIETTRVRHPEGRICAVSHADVIKALLAHVLGFSLDRHAALEVGPASLSVLCAGDWGMKVLSVNEACR